MKPRITTLIVAAVGWLASTTPSNAADEAPLPRRPNIVFILADDKCE